MLPNTEDLNSDQRDIVYAGYVDVVKDVIGHFGKSAHFRIAKDLARIHETIQIDVDSFGIDREEESESEGRIPDDSLRVLGAVAALETVLENGF